MRMNEDPLLYGNYNKVTRRDAIECLEEYGSKLRWNRIGERILDIGSADGSVTNILTKYIPNDYDVLIGCDINENAVKFAKHHHEDEKTKFMVLDIESDLPRELVGSFDHVFSFYTLHWPRNQEKIFMNIFNLLSKGGECFLTFLGRATVYSLFGALTRTSKWGPWLTGFDKFVSPYHDCHNPDIKIANILSEAGFRDVDVRCTQKMFVYENMEYLKKAVTSVSPFKIPDDMYEDFMNDFIQVARDMRIVDESNNSVTFHYNLIVVHCRK